MRLFMLMPQQRDSVIHWTGYMGQSSVVVGATAAEAHEDDSVYGAVECQAACALGPHRYPSWPLG